MKASRFGRVLMAQLALLTPIAVVAQLPPAADSFINSGAAGTNYGDKTTLDLQSQRIGLVSFDLSALPMGASVAKATVRLSVSSVNTAGSFSVFPIKRHGPECRHVRHPANTGGARRWTDIGLDRELGGLPARGHHCARAGLGEWVDCQQRGRARPVGLDGKVFLRKQGERAPAGARGRAQRAAGSLRTAGPCWTAGPTGFVRTAGADGGSWSTGTCWTSRSCRRRRGSEDRRYHDRHADLQSGKRRSRVAFDAPERKHPEGRRPIPPRWW